MSEHKHDYSPETIKAIENFGTDSGKSLSDLFCRKVAHIGHEGSGLGVAHALTTACIGSDAVGFPASSLLPECDTFQDMADYGDRIFHIIATRRALWHNIEHSSMQSSKTAFFAKDRKLSEVTMLQAGRMVKELDFILNQIKDDHE